jgi:hypothetical protein
MNIAHFHGHDSADLMQENTSGESSLFGLVHGLGFADALSPLALAGWSLAGALAGFNLGVELGQAIAIGLTLPVVLGIGRLARAVLVYRYASLAVAMAGAYWLIERISLG